MFKNIEDKGIFMLTDNLVQEFCPYCEPPKDVWVIYDSDSEDKIDETPNENPCEHYVGARDMKGVDSLELKEPEYDLRNGSEGVYFYWRAGGDVSH